MAKVMQNTLSFSSILSMGDILAGNKASDQLGYPHVYCKQIYINLLSKSLSLTNPMKTHETTSTESMHVYMQLVWAHV